METLGSGSGSLAKSYCFSSVEPRARTRIDGRARFTLFFLVPFFNRSRKKEAELQSLKVANLNQELVFKKQDVTRMALEISNKQELAEQVSDQFNLLEPYIQSAAKPISRKLNLLIKSH